MEHVSLEEVQDGIVVLTIDRPDRRNALSNKVLAELHEAVDRIGSDPAIRVVILTGAGAGFSAGADMKGGPEESQGLGGTPTGADRSSRPRTAWSGPSPARSSWPACSRRSTASASR